MLFLDVRPISDSLERTQYSDISNRGGEEEEGVRSTCLPPPALPDPQSCCSLGLPHGEEPRPWLGCNAGVLVRPAGAAGAGRTSRGTGHQETSTALLSQPAERRQDSLFYGPQNLSIVLLPPRDSLVIVTGSWPLVCLVATTLLFAPSACTEAPGPLAAGVTPGCLLSAPGLHHFPSVWEQICLHSS